MEVEGASCHFLGEDPLLYPLTGNSPKARHRAGVIADQKVRRGKRKETTYILTQRIQMYWKDITH